MIGTSCAEVDVFAQQPYLKFDVSVFQRILNGLQTLIIEDNSRE